MPPHQPLKRVRMMLSLGLFALAAFLADAAIALSPIGHTIGGAPLFLAPSGSFARQSGRNMNIFARNGSILHVFENVIPASLTAKRDSAPARRQVLNVNEAFVKFDPDIIVDSLNASFTVPAPPESFESQIIYFAQGVQALDPDTGIAFGMHRVALQYGGSFVQGGSFWTICTQLEFLDEAGQPAGVLQIIPNESPIVQPGDRLATSIQFDDAFVEDGIFFYNAQWLGRPDFSFEAGWEFPPRVAGFKLEEEGVEVASDYPKEFMFENILLNLTTGIPDVHWQTTVDPASGIEWKVEKNGARNAEIAVVFPYSL
ncbi:hypothetical protein MKEN_00233800 [Mycena kentingensis (nom. inval.)]|nr:hypothetical protein MKEN_00233800 [Mycena kentingensis (nom. inval.)]